MGSRNRLPEGRHTSHFFTIDMLGRLDLDTAPSLTTRSGTAGDDQIGENETPLGIHGRVSSLGSQRHLPKVGDRSRLSRTKPALTRLSLTLPCGRNHHSAVQRLCSTIRHDRSGWLKFPASCHRHRSASPAAVPTVGAVTCTAHGQRDLTGQSLSPLKISSRYCW
jgi:hypothetical protein